MFEQVDQLLSRKSELEELLSQDSWETRAAFITATQEYARIQSVLELKREFDGVVQTIQDNQVLLEESAEDPEMTAVIQEDMLAAESRHALLEKIDIFG